MNFILNKILQTMADKCKIHDSFFQWITESLVMTSKLGLLRHVLVIIFSISNCTRNIFIHLIMERIDGHC